MGRSGQVAILGAGPIGLEAALAAADAGRPFTVYEAAPHAGGHVRRWGHVPLFTSWARNVSPRMRRHLEAAGAGVPGGPECPTGHQLARSLLDPLAALPEVAPHLRLGARVEAVGRQDLLKHEEIATPARAERPFRLLVRDRSGREDLASADVVLDCTGTYGRPNAVGDGGIPALGERALGEEIHRALPDLDADGRRWAGRTTLLVGAGHSAQTAALGLAGLAGRAPGTRVVWAVRSAAPTWGAVPHDPLPERAALVERAGALAGGEEPAVELRTGVVVERLARHDGRVAVTLRGDGGTEEVVVDRVLALTGFVGDHDLYRQLQVHECYATAAPIQLAAALLGEGAGDCLDQTSQGVDTLRNPEPNFFILGVKSYGRNNLFLMSVGWGQVEEVFAALSGDPGPAG
ncbi:MAG: NAD(P)-binding protein [Acidimicrobiales bacterium]